MKLINSLLFIGAIFVIVSCSKSSSNPLPSWNDTAMKSKIINFVQNEVPKIPVQNRLAVFDLDGTLACEKPLWFEMYCAVQGLCLQVQKDSSLLNQTIYQYAEKLSKNPADTSVTNHWGKYIDPMILSAFNGWENENYINFCSKYLDIATNPDYNIVLKKTFYPPMFDLIQYLRRNNFEIYVVSGSLQGLIWAVVPNQYTINRQHMIGTSQSLSFSFYPGGKASFILQPLIYQPKDNNDGKAINIYSHISKTPVFAFGNTTGDFDMFKLTTSNSLPNICFLLNHNDSTREYAYPPFYSNTMPAWRDTMRVYGWNIVDMKENFKTIFEKP
jgi:phosphoserine phosphatase